jgi:uncharacterized membrane protein
MASDVPCRYQIVFREDCANLLAGILGDAVIESRDGCTCVVAMVRDQSEFYGLLDRFAGMALRPVSLIELDPRIPGATRPSSSTAGDLAPGPLSLGFNARRSRERGKDMAIGPVQLIVLGFNHPNFHGEVIAELERLREQDMVRVIDALAVYKDAEGELEVEHLSNLTEDEAIELGSKIGALIGLGFEGEEGMEAGAIAGAEEAAAEGGVNVFNEEEAWDVLEDIPNDSAAALVLLEHHWAVPLRDAIARAGGFRISDGFISPLDLVAIGLVSAEEARELHDLETAGAAESA